MGRRPAYAARTHGALCPLVIVCRADFPCRLSSFSPSSSSMSLLRASFPEGIMTNPQLLQPQHSQSIRSSALKSNKNVCTADKLGFVLDTSTHSLELKQEIKSSGLASPCRHASPLKAKHSLTDLLLGMTPDKSSMICFRPHHLLDRCFARCRNSFCFHSNPPYFLPRSEPKRQ